MAQSFAIRLVHREDKQEKDQFRSGVRSLMSEKGKGEGVQVDALREPEDGLMTI
jgi:hypothetical protein